MDAEQEDYYENVDSCLKSKIKCLWNNCNQLFSKLDELAIHVNDEHVKMEKESDFACRWEGCSRKGRCFNARYKMLIHVRTHTNEKPHMCRQCGKSFSRLENLKIHNRSHTGEKPYICPIEGCGKAYSNSSDRFKHTRTHFVDKPYFCKKDGCNKRYTDPSSLRKHMKTYGHYREERTCIIKSKLDNKQCISTCNGESKSEAIVSASKVKCSFLHNYADKINTTVLSASPVLTVNVPSLIPNPIFATNLLKPSFAALEKYYLVKTNGTSFDLNSFHNIKNDTCPLDLTVKECSNDFCLNNENI